MITAPYRALKPAWNFDTEQYLARLQQIVELGDIVHFAGEMEIGGVFQRFEDRAREVAVLLQQYRGRQIARRGVDGVAEQQQLHHRDHHGHPARDAVALELDEFLDHHRKTAPPEAESRFADVASMIGLLGDDTHWKLSFERVISSRKTSATTASLSAQSPHLPSRYSPLPPPTPP